MIPNVPRSPAHIKPRCCGKRTFPPLTKAQRATVEKFLPLVHGMVSRLSRGKTRRLNANDLDDAFQFGVVELIKALHRYKPDHGSKAKLATFLVHSLEYQFRGYFCQPEHRLVHVPRNRPDLIPRYFVQALGDSEHQLFATEKPDQEVTSEFVGAVKKFLPPRWFEILADSIVHGMTLQALGEKYGVTRERVRQIRVSAIKRVRRFMPLKERLRFGIEDMS